MELKRNENNKTERMKNEQITRRRVRIERILKLRAFEGKVNKGITSIKQQSHAHHLEGQNTQMETRETNCQ